MKRCITLLVLSFAMVFAANAADDTKDGKEKTWSIGIGKKGVTVEEVENEKTQRSANATSTQTQPKRVRTRNTTLETDPRWSQVNPTCLSGNIDVAYVRLKKEFGYMTAEERIARTPGADGDLNYIKRQGGFEYVAQQGVYYLMRDKTKRTGNRIVQAELTTDGENTYCLSYGFVNTGLLNPTKYSNDLGARMISAVN